jgi:hypothetical protein
VKARCDVAVDADFPSRYAAGFDSKALMRHGHRRRR